MNIKYNSIEKLENSSKKHKSLPRSFIKELLTFIKSNIEDIAVIRNLFKLDTNFYRKFCEGLSKNDDSTIVSDNVYYKNFARLIKFGLIHKSSSYFPKGLSLISINPNPEFLLTDKYRYVDLYAQEKQKLIKKMIDSFELDDIYIYLRFFTERKIPKKYLSLISFDDMIVITNDLVIQYIQIEDFLGNTSYELHIYDKVASNALFRLKDVISKNRVFNNIDAFEKVLKKFRDDKLEPLNYVDIQKMSNIISTYENTPLYNQVITKKIKTVRLTISEIQVLFPKVAIPNHLIESETKALERVQSSDKDSYDEDDVININFDNEEFESSFKLSQIESIIEFLKSKDNIVSNSISIKIIIELKNYTSIDKTVHAKIIVDYLIYLFEFLKNRKLAPSTVRGYVRTLNQHLFSKVKDLNDIQINEYENINRRLNSGKYASTTKKSASGIIRRFFKYYKKKFNCSLLFSFSYPKSLILDFEVEPILIKIKKNYITDNEISRIGTITHYDILQHQVMLLFAFYSGMRKNELRSRLYEDFILINNTIHVDVNNTGLRIQKLKLKTGSSKRKINFSIPLEFMNLVLQWYELREKLNIKSKYLFVQKSKSGNLTQKIIAESSIDFISKSIKEVTNRYCSFHSLRHSFVSYNINDLIFLGSDNPYDVLDLSVETGHITPETTLTSYTHADLLNLLRYR